MTWNEDCNDDYDDCHKDGKWHGWRNLYWGHVRNWWPNIPINENVGVERDERESETQQRWSRDESWAETRAQQRRRVNKTGRAPCNKKIKALAATRWESAATAARGDNRHAHERQRERERRAFSASNADHWAAHARVCIRRACEQRRLPGALKARGA